ncbi:hypothetical protein IPH92_03785 [Candidatus Kaiserbacteria bacterium]|nr:MAG: hypothetical protein IPH92_03785 [Candidatus Kaiserbacteria bacterium]
MNKALLRYTLTTVVSLALVVTVVSAWTGPWTPPPPDPTSQNVSAPINVGPDSQTKVGKINTASTVALDVGTTLVTKDYVDNRAINKRRIVFTSTQDWVVPSNVTSAEVTMAGGGGSGVGWRVVNAVFAGHSGGYVFSHPISLTPGETIHIQVGRGGRGSAVVNTGVLADRGAPYYIYTYPSDDDGLGGYPGSSSKITSSVSGTLLECSGGSGAYVGGVDTYLGGIYTVAGHVDGAIVGGGTPAYSSPNRVATGSFVAGNGPGACGPSLYGIGNRGPIQWAVSSGIYPGGTTPFGYGSGGSVFRSGCHTTASYVGTCTNSDVGRDGVVILDVIE